MLCKFVGVENEYLFLISLLNKQESADSQKKVQYQAYSVFSTITGEKVFSFVNSPAYHDDEAVQGVYIFDVKLTSKLNKEENNIEDAQNEDQD